MPTPTTSTIIISSDEESISKRKKKQQSSTKTTKKASPIILIDDKDDVDDHNDNIDIASDIQYNSNANTYKVESTVINDSNNNNNNNNNSSNNNNGIINIKPSTPSKEDIFKEFIGYDETDNIEDDDIFMLKATLGQLDNEDIKQKVLNNTQQSTQTILDSVNEKEQDEIILGNVDNNSNNNGRRRPRTSISAQRYFIGETIKCEKCGAYDDHPSFDCPNSVEDRPCFRCGEFGHYTSTCPQYICFKCGLYGHYPRLCYHKNMTYFNNSDIKLFQKHKGFSFGKMYNAEDEDEKTIKEKQTRMRTRMAEKEREMKKVSKKKEDKRDWFKGSNRDHDWRSKKMSSRYSDRDYNSNGGGYNSNKKYGGGKYNKTTEYYDGDDDDYYDNSYKSKKNNYNNKYNQNQYQNQNQTYKRKRDDYDNESYSNNNNYNSNKKNKISSNTNNSNSGQSQNKKSLNSKSDKSTLKNSNNSIKNNSSKNNSNKNNSDDNYHHFNKSLKQFKVEDYRNYDRDD
ncbi:hypothetical protein CYY_001267 [Polysphondylium violaceum]|uniref:CCHC-type domain-containing protein n=1 Tax=Polysphondylium violaceum TaxID=133409 RepID=A0A8J4PYG0_9MYCE|nr:hypothetical protein CYY_001267 [Polysphondylium violaceum]